MNFFKASDFAGSTELIDHISWKDAATVANRKLGGLKKYIIKAYSSGKEFTSEVWAYERPLVLTISEVEEIVITADDQKACPPVGEKK